MKPLEEIFFRACVNEQKRKLRSSDRELSIRTIGNIFERLGFSYKQLMYYVRKWCDKGFYDYGVTLDLGWFEFGKLTGEYKQIYDSMTGTDRWKDGELASYIVNNSFNRERITNFAFREIQPHKIGGRNGEPIDCSTLEDEPVIVADNEADRQKFYECFYKQEPIEPNNKKCNLTFCRYNTDRECTNDEKREECVEVSRKVLFINEENKK